MTDFCDLAEKTKSCASDAGVVCLLSPLVRPFVRLRFLDTEGRGISRIVCALVPP